MDTMQLKKDENGNVLQVVTSSTTQEVSLSSDELIRQIKEHSAIVNNLQAQLEAVQAFEQGDSDEQEVTVTEASKPLIDQVKLDAISVKEVKVTSKGVKA